MGKMLISAWLAVASGKLGGRSLTGDANDDVFKNLVNGEDVPDDLLKVIPTSPDLNPDDEPLTAELEWDKLDDLLSKTPTADPLAASNPNPNEPAQSIGGNDESSSTQAPAKVVEQVNVEPLGDGNGGDGLETGSDLGTEENEHEEDLDPDTPAQSGQQQQQQQPPSGGAAKEPKEMENEEDILEEELSAASPASLKPVVVVDPASLTSEDKQAFDIFKADLKKNLVGAGKVVTEQIVIDGATKLLDVVKGELKKTGGNLVDFVENAAGVSEFVDKAKGFLNDPDSILEEFKKLKPKQILDTITKLDPNDALVTYLKNEKKSVSQNVIAGVFFVHAILFFGDLILTFVPIPKFLRWIASLVFGSSSILFMFTNGVAVWAAYTRESPEKTKKYYYVAGIYFIVQAADLITYFLGFGPLKIIYKFLSYGYKLVYLADAIIVTLIPLYFVHIHDPTKVGEGWTWLTKQFR